MQNSPIKKVNHGEVQLRKPPIITAEEEKALRDQLHLEIENKTKACSFSKYDCGGQRLVGYEYCLKHILQDPRAPYKQCAYAYPITGKRCLQPAPKYESRRNVAWVLVWQRRSFPEVSNQFLLQIHKLLLRAQSSQSTLQDSGHHREAEASRNPGILPQWTFALRQDRTIADSCPGHGSGRCDSLPGSLL